MFDFSPYLLVSTFVLLITGNFCKSSSALPVFQAGSVSPGAFHFLSEYIIINGRAKRAASEASQKGHLTSSGFIIISIIHKFREVSIFRHFGFLP